MSSGWGFSEDNSAPSTAGWGFESSDGASARRDSGPEYQGVEQKNRTRRIMTTLPEFTMHLARSGLQGPKCGEFPGILKSAWAQRLGAGSQFTVFVDTRSDVRPQAIKRVSVFEGSNDDLEQEQRRREEDANLRKRLYVLEREILALCHPPIREHRNVAKIFSWGYDYRRDNTCPRVPILYMERALCSLFSFLTCDDFKDTSSVPRDIIGYHICLDVAEGLEVLHQCGIVHGDIKPHNILIFPQDNPKVPYIGKLSDFGASLTLRGEDAFEDFTAYCGTPGWRPPEAVKYVKEIHGPFSPELLLRSDSFSYGLLVLSVFTAGGCPPLSKSLEATQQAASSSPIEGPLDDALAALSRASHLQKFLQTKLRLLLPRVLRSRPENRDLVCSEILADVKEEAYLNWRLQKDDSLQSKPPNQAPNTGIRYWLDAEKTLLKELDEQHDYFIERGEDPEFPGEVLYGMSIAILCREFGRNPGHRDQLQVDRALRYMTASAISGFCAAQGICEQLHKALGYTLPDGIGETTRLQWLYNAASTGSLLANEILLKSNPGLSTSAILEFRKNGGYNSHEYPHTIKMRETLLDESNLASIMRTHDINTYTIDAQGNCLLHLASMVGNEEATRTLLSSNSTDPNSRNKAGETPLLLACKAGHAAIVRLLVKGGADASICDISFSTGPLHWLFNFAADEIPDIGRILVQKANSPVNHRIIPLESPTTPQPGERGYPRSRIHSSHLPFEWPYGTALHWATFAKSRAAIDILCEMGGDIDAPDLEPSDLSQTALSMAVNRADAETVDYLLKKGASHRKVARHSKLPLYFGCCGGGEDKKANWQSLVGWTDLQSWIWCGSSSEYRSKVEDIVKMLVSADLGLEGKLYLGNIPYV